MIAAVVLAAGASRRFGKQKLLAPVQGRPLVRWTVDEVLASGVERVVVVVGREAAGVRAALEELPVAVCENPRYAEGMSTSIRAGIDALDPAVEAVLVVLGDQPISRTILERLLRAWRASRLPIVAPSYRGQRGNPVLFSSSLFDELRRLEGDRGARALVGRSPGRVLLVPFPHPPPPDIDTPEEHAAHARTLARGLQRPEGSAGDPSRQGDS